jgi:hypothetical protein
MAGYCTDPACCLAVARQGRETRASMRDGRWRRWHWAKRGKDEKGVTATWEGGTACSNCCYCYMGRGERAKAISTSSTQSVSATVCHVATVVAFTSLCAHNSSSGRAEVAPKVVGANRQRTTADAHGRFFFFPGPPVNRPPVSLSAMRAHMAALVHAAPLVHG